MRIEGLSVEPLHVPLVEPFVIATARMDRTRAGLVRATVRDDDGRVETGLGEAAPLPPVTHEDWPDVEASVLRASSVLEGRRVEVGEGGALPLLDELFLHAPVARAGVEAALLDAVARLRGLSVARLLAPSARAVELETDVTLPIAAPSHMIELAREWRARGFTRFKVKVGKDLDDDARALLGVHEAVPDARFRLDANEGYTADRALELLRRVRALTIECFEQPCRRDDLDGMARVTRDGGVIVIADESLRSRDDFDRIVSARAAHGVNLKLVKLGGLAEAYAIGFTAKSLGMHLMCGAMVETRLGLVAMAQVVAALGGVEFVDLDTAFLLDGEPFEGGWSVSGPMLRPTLGLGLDVRLRER